MEEIIMNRKVISIVAVFGFLVMTAAVPGFSAEKPNINLEKPAEGIVVDLKTQDCRTLLKMSGGDRDFTIVFYHGFMSGKKNDTVFNGPELSAITDQIYDHCIDNPNDSLLTVFEAKRK
jgi:hypothetical protein